MSNRNRLRIFRAIGLIGSLLLAAGLTGLIAAAEPPKSKGTIAVVEFAIRGSDLDPQAGAIIADSLTSAIASIGYFTLKDRMSLSAIAKLARKNPLGSIGPVDAETAIQLGTLYGLQGVITGTISRLGDRVIVTARLIDTRTGAILRSGEIQEKDLDAVQVKLDQLALSITTAPPTQSLRALTVRTEPDGAAIKLLNIHQAYQPGIRLPSGVYEIEVSHSGYVPQKVNARILQNDVNLLVHLEKNRYALTIDIEPPQSKIRILNLQQPYQPGIKLEAGVYQFELSCPSYQTTRKTLTIADADLNVVLKLEPQNPVSTVPVKSAPTRQSSTRNRPNRQNRVVEREATQRNQPVQEERGSLRQEFRNFRHELKRVFW